MARRTTNPVNATADAAETSTDDCPKLPTTLEELVETASRCGAASVAVVPARTRDESHQPTLDLRGFTEIVPALRSETPLVVQLSTGGSLHDPLNQRLRALGAEPDSYSLTIVPQLWRRGSVQLVALHYRDPTAHPAAGEVPEFEVFNLSHVA